MTVLCPAHEAQGTGTWQLQAGIGMSPSPEVMHHFLAVPTTHSKNATVLPHLIPSLPTHSHNSCLPEECHAHTHLWIALPPQPHRALLPLQWAPAGGKPPQSRWDHPSTLVNAAPHCQWQHTQDQCGQGGQPRAALTQIQSSLPPGCPVPVLEAVRGAEHVARARAGCQASIQHVIRTCRH